MFGIFKRINWSKLPSIVWVFVILGGLFAFIASIIGLFWALANIEGFGSLIFFLIGYKFIRGTGNNVGDAIIILFFALMGVAVDQPGNWLYNKPLEFWQCTDRTHLVRGVIVTHPLPGRTDVSQDFTCVDDQENIVKRIEVPAILVVRFVEYITLGYFFIAFHQILSRIRRKQAEASIDSATP